MSTELEVFETVHMNGALEVASAPSRPRSALSVGAQPFAQAWVFAGAKRSGVVTADLCASYQGTDLSFAGVEQGIAVGNAPREGDVSGTRAWSPPV